MVALSDNDSTWRRLRERKLVQWAVAYLAGAWLLLEVIDVVGGRFGLTDALYRVLVVAAVVGFFVALVLAWYHGEKGRQRVSGPELLILALLFAVGGGVLRLLNRGEAVEAAPSAVGASTAMQRIAERLALDDRPGIAVLPFAHRSGVEEDRYFTDGLHDELLTRLTTISGLRVIARTSVEPYRDTPKDVREIGDELGVGYVLEGGVQRAGDRIRLNVQLIDAESGAHLWSETYDSEATPAELLDVQTRLSLRIAAELQVAVVGEERERLYRRSTDDPEAYDLWLRALANGTANPARRSRGIEYLSRAVALDPGFISAHAGLANRHAMQYQMGVDRSEERARLALESVERVAELAPGSSWERMARATYAYRILRDFDTAREELRSLEDELARAAPTLRLQAVIERREGDFENAIQFLERSLAVDPHAGWRELAECLDYLGRYDEAEEILRTQLAGEMDESTREGLENVHARVLLNRDADLDEAWQTIPDPWLENALPWAFRGRDARRIRVLLDGFEQDILQGDYPSSMNVILSPYVFEPVSLWSAWAALIEGDSAAARDDFEEARRQLERAIEEDPEDDRRHRAMGLVLAGLGRADEAVRHARRALELLPPDRDALAGPFNVRGLARIHAQLGNTDEALEWLEDYLSRPVRESARWLELDPLLDPIRDDARFRQLIDRHWPVDAGPRAEGS